MLAYFLLQGEGKHFPGGGDEGRHGCWAPVDQECLGVGPQAAVDGPSALGRGQVLGMLGALGCLQH